MPLPTELDNTFARNAEFDRRSAHGRLMGRWSAETQADGRTIGMHCCRTRSHNVCERGYSTDPGQLACFLAESDIVNHIQAGLEPLPAAICTMLN